MLITCQVLPWISGKELALLKPQFPAVKAGAGQLHICSGVPSCVPLSKCCSGIELLMVSASGQGQVGQQHLKDRNSCAAILAFLSLPHVNHWESLTPGCGTQMLVAHWEVGFANVEQQHCLSSVGPPERCCRQFEHYWRAAAACWWH